MNTMFWFQSLYLETTRKKNVEIRWNRVPLNIYWMNRQHSVGGNDLHADRTWRNLQERFAVAKNTEMSLYKKRKKSLWNIQAFTGLDKWHDLRLMAPNLEWWVSSSVKALLMKAQGSAENFAITVQWPSVWRGRSNPQDWGLCQCCSGASGQTGAERLGRIYCWE